MKTESPQLKLVNVRKWVYIKSERDQYPNIS